MVLSNGSKSARLQQSICNLQNVCGGVKKAGVAPRVGFFLSNANPEVNSLIQNFDKKLDSFTKFDQENQAKLRILVLGLLSILKSINQQNSHVSLSQFKIRVLAI